MAETNIYEPEWIKSNRKIYTAEWPIYVDRSLGSVELITPTTTWLEGNRGYLCGIITYKELAMPLIRTRPQMYCPTCKQDTWRMQIRNSIFEAAMQIEAICGKTKLLTA